MMQLRGLGDDSGDWWDTLKSQFEAGATTPPDATAETTDSSAPQPVAANWWDNLVTDITQPTKLAQEHAAQQAAANKTPSTLSTIVSTALTVLAPKPTTPAVMTPVVAPNPLVTFLKSPVGLIAIGVGGWLTYRHFNPPKKAQALSGRRR